MKTFALLSLATAGAVSASAVPAAMAAPKSAESAEVAQLRSQLASMRRNLAAPKQSRRRLEACENGAGGTFDYNTNMDNSAIAQAACESVYGSCTTGSCGYFYYWYENGGRSCDCSKEVGKYEFVYDNTGYNGVGNDYGGADTDVSGNTLFVRVKAEDSCTSNSWNLARGNLGECTIDTGDYTGLIIDNNQALVSMGENADVKLFRSDVSTLTIEADIELIGDMYINGSPLSEALGGGNLCDNGAGGAFECDSSLDAEGFAKKACESHYGSGLCAQGTCGSFYYWYHGDHRQCDCSKDVGNYEWVWQNTGYEHVGDDYGGADTDVSMGGTYPPFVRVKSDGSCSSDSWELTLIPLRGSAHLMCDNGAGGMFDSQGEGVDSNEVIAKLACESYYGSGNCAQSSCGSFSYWYHGSHSSCDCNKEVGSYEWIYANSGYSRVGQDYGGASTDVSGNELFVRVKADSSCTSNSWNLALFDLGVCEIDTGRVTMSSVQSAIDDSIAELMDDMNPRVEAVETGVADLFERVDSLEAMVAALMDAVGAGCDNGAGGTFECGDNLSNEEIAMRACESHYGSGTCTTGSCGYFYYYYYSSHRTCDCSKSEGAYEWIYNNAGYDSVGNDYGGKYDSVSGDSLFVRMKSSNTCNSDSWTLALKDLSATPTYNFGGCDNGAGGTFDYPGGDNSAIAQAACESHYGSGSCTTGGCGSFSYWYHGSHRQCDCSKETGNYEWIYSNTGYSQVGQDYGGGTTDVSGDELFVRVKGSDTCNSDSWKLAHKDLGAGCTSGDGYNAGTGVTFQCDGCDQTGAALAACEATYGSGMCTTGSCGSHSYYYCNGCGHRSCDCSKAVGTYEFIYSSGYSQVGQDYGGAQTDITGYSGSFVRIKAENSCTSNSWNVALGPLWPQ